jgi:hypothetical protein
MTLMVFEGTWRVGGSMMGTEGGEDEHDDDDDHPSRLCIAR